MAETSFWKQCSSCKNEIQFSTMYQVCSVSTCNRKRTGMVFCSVGCWEIHLPMMRHREAWAVEKRSPTQAEWQRELEQENEASSLGSSSSSSSGSSSSGSRSSAPAVRRSSPSPALPVGAIGSRSLSEVSSRPPPDKPPPRAPDASPQPAAAETSSASAATALPASTAAAMARPTGERDGFTDLDESEMPRDILIVVSKLKKYIRARSGMNTSDGAMAILSDHVRAICRQAIRNAARDERKTVLDRDIPRPPRS